MEPLDPECPSLSPNYYDVCPLIDRFVEYTNKKGIVVDYSETEEKNEDSFDLLSIFGMVVICFFVQVSF